MKIGVGGRLLDLPSLVSVSFLRTHRTVLRFYTYLSSELSTLKFCIWKTFKQLEGFVSTFSKFLGINFSSGTLIICTKPYHEHIPNSLPPPGPLHPPSLSASTDFPTRCYYVTFILKGKMKCLFSSKLSEKWHFLTAACQN